MKKTLSTAVGACLLASASVVLAAAGPEAGQADAARGAEGPPAQLAMLCPDQADKGLVLDKAVPATAITPDAVLDRYLRLHELSAGSGLRGALMPWSDLQSLAD